MRDRLINSRAAKRVIRIANGVDGLFRRRHHEGEAPPEFLESRLTARAEIELTTKCNLKCVYCPSLQPTYQGRELDLRHVPEIVETLEQRSVLAVGVSGHGESTIVSGWTRHCQAMLDAGLELFLTTNLAKSYTDQEIDTLSRFLVIQISCDTIDPKLFRLLRRPAELETILYNMGRIRAAAIKEKRREPTLWWNAVVSDLNIGHLEDYVAFGLGQGVKHFNFINLKKHPDVEGVATVRHLSELSIDEMEEALEIFDRTFRLVRQAGGSYIANTALDPIRRRLDNPGQTLVEDGVPLHSTDQPLGMTRDCLDPWVFVKVCADTGVRPCCAQLESLGFLDRNERLEDILNGEHIRAYRRGLFTGNLMPACSWCNVRGWTDIATLQLKVKLWKILGRAFLPIHKLGILLPILHWWRR